MSLPIEGVKNTSVKKTKKIFWFRYNNELPFAIDDERDASELFYNYKPGRWMKAGLKYVGQSDGSIYYGIMKKIETERAGIKKEIDKIKEDLKKYDETFQKWKFEEIVSDDDPKMKRLNETTTKLEDKLEKLTKDYGDIKRGVEEKAITSETKEAQKDKTPPENMNFRVHEKMSDKKVSKDVFGKTFNLS